MNEFQSYLDSIGEIGFIQQVFSSLIYVKGLPSAFPGEYVIFETGESGQVLSLMRDYVEVLLFTTTQLQVGTKVARTGKALQIAVGEALLGQTIDPLGRIQNGKAPIKTLETRAIDTVPSGITGRKNVIHPFETGFPIVDLLVPFGMGQRELIIGDRKTGKTTFILQTMRNQAAKGTVCIYAAVGKRRSEITRVAEFFQTHKIDKQTVMITSSASDPSGVIFLTPYAAMTVAEYFRDQGKDVMLIIDDLTTHAQCYREITLLARRFPGRSSYPGDIFYIHSKLLERAGSFQKGTISTFPLAESVLGDLSGYIQTNLMAITDGHLFFDTEVFNEGRRPAVHPFLSVTRVGEQAQSDLVRDVSRQLSRFLVHYQKLKELVHFGSEFEERVRKDLRLGNRIFAFFNQKYNLLFPLPVSIFIVGMLWNGLWSDEDDQAIADKSQKLVESYYQNAQTKQQIDTIIKQSKNFQTLVTAIRDDPTITTTHS